MVWGEGSGWWGEGMGGVRAGGAHSAFTGLPVLAAPFRLLALTSRQP